MANDGGPAFPHTAADGHPDYRRGMSLRDWFAGQAMNDQIAFESYRLADAMLAERAK